MNVNYNKLRSEDNKVRRCAKSSKQIKQYVVEYGLEHHVLQIIGVFPDVKRQTRGADAVRRPRTDRLLEDQVLIARRENLQACERNMNFRLESSDVQLCARKQTRE